MTCEIDKRICKGWDTAYSVLETGSYLMYVCHYSLLGLYALGRTSRVADIQRLAYLQLFAVPVNVVDLAKQRFYDKRPISLSNALFGLSLGCGLSILLHESAIISLGKYASSLGRARSAFLAMFTALGTVRIIQFLWNKPREERPKLFYGYIAAGIGSTILASLTAIHGRYSLKLAGLRALIGIPMATYMCFMTGLTVKNLCWPSQPGRRSNV